MRLSRCWVDDGRIHSNSIGAVIAGVIGLITVYIQQRWQPHESVNEIILGPLYNLLLEAEQVEPGKYPGADPWKTVGKYDRMKVRKKVRRAYQAFATRLGEYEAAEDASRSEDTVHADLP